MVGFDAMIYHIKYRSNNLMEVVMENEFNQMMKLIGNVRDVIACLIFAVEHTESACDQ